MKHQTILGVDPGKKGSVAVLYRGQLAAVRDLELDIDGKRLDAPHFAGMLDLYQPDIVVSERLHAMPTGTVANFSLGDSTGMIRGVAAGARIQFADLAPKAWKTAVDLPGDGRNEQKAAALEMCRQLWPDNADDWFKFKKHADRADAALIAYGWSRLNPEHETTPNKEQAA